MFKEMKMTAPRFSFALRIESLQGQGRLQRIILPPTSFSKMQSSVWRLGVAIEGHMRRLGCDGCYFDYKMGVVILYRNVEVVDGSNYKLESRLTRIPVACIYTEEIRTIDEN